MANDTISGNTRWVRTFDRILENLNREESLPVRTMEIEGGREVVIVQPNAFTISRIYTTGRPDGFRPQGMDSYYDYFAAKLEEYEAQQGSREGFRLKEEEWQTLFEESFHRYTRYLLFAGIKRWADVERDTAINIAVTNLAREFAPSEVAWQSYQYKGYMVMMHSIAKAELRLLQGDIQEALQHIDTGIQQIGEYCGECLREEQGEAENVTRERYLNNLIEYRSDLETLDAEIERGEAESEEENILAALERLLNEDEDDDEDTDLAEDGEDEA